MVKLRTLPDPGTVRAFKGSIDFYTWKDIAVARGWPKKPDQSRSPNIRLQQPHLADANIAYRDTGPTMLPFLREQASFGTHTARDVFMRHYFGTSLLQAGHQPRSTHLHSYPAGHRILGVLRGRLSRFGGSATRQETHHRPPPAFLHPDPHEHYWYLRNLFMLIDFNGNLIVQAFPNRPGDYRLMGARSLPSLTWVRSERRGITRTAYPDWHDNNNHFTPTATVGPFFGDVFWTLDQLQTFLPNKYITFYILRHHTAGNLQCWSRSPLFVTFVRPQQDYLDGGGLPFHEWGIPRPVGPGYAAPSLRGETLYPHEKPWPEDGPLPEPPFWIP